MKDLRIMRNRDISQIIIVDNSISAFACHLENGIYIPSYYGQADDNCLKDIMELLKLIANCKDVREKLDQFVGLKELYEQYVN